MKKLILLAMIFGQFSLASQTRYYVSQSASGSGNGLSWQDAFTQLDAALSAAQSGDEVWVAQGTYYPTTGTDRGKSFAPPSGIKLYGGFTGSETDITQRDWLASPVVLSGDIGAPGDSTDNSYNVVYMLQPDSTTVLDGFVVAYGQADNVAMSAHNRDRFVCGGGLYMESGNWDAFATVRHCRFYKNTAHSQGGGVMLNGTLDGRVAPRFIDCVFEGNHAGDTGGGMGRYGGSGIERGDELKGCTFVKNSADKRGGALYYADTKGVNTVGIASCDFKQNYAKLAGGGAYLSLGKQETGGVTIRKSNFTENSSDGATALILFTNGLDFDGYFELDSCVFEGNIGIGSNNNSSVVYNDILSTVGSEISIKNTSMSQHNKVLHLIGWENAKVKWLNNVINNNNNIAGIALIVSNATSNTFVNCSFSNNKITQILYKSFVSGGNSHPLKFENCIFELNSKLLGYFGVSSSKSVTVTNSSFLFNDFQTPNLIQFMGFNNVDSLLLYNNLITDSLYNYSFIYSFTDPKYVYLSHNFFSKFSCSGLPVNTQCGPGNLFNFDPQFIDPANHDYRLAPCSPLINAGSNAVAAGLLTDIAGAPRIQESTVDIGAYESPAFALAAAPDILPACAGANGGAITISPENGCEPYTYNWQPAAGNGPEISSLPPGDYAYTVTDARGRKLTDTLSIAPAPSPQLAPVGQDLQCGSPLGGSATVAVTNGAAPYSFIWQDGAIDSLRAMLPAGQYQVTVTDRNGCTGAAQVTVGKQGNITLMVDGQPISCTGAADAAISAAPVNGKAPYQYLWSPAGSSDSLLTGLGPGAYTVTVTDFYGCTATYTFTISDPPLLQAAVLAMHCSSLQSPNGIATAAPSGGTPPHAYAWSNLGGTMTIGGLPPGIYTVTVTDAHGCTATASAEVKLVSGTVDLAGIQVQVWPNPTRERLALRAAGLPSGPWRFVLRDALGREVASADVAGDSAVLDVRDLSPGAYCWALEGAGGVMARGKVLR